MQQAASSVDVLGNPENVKILANILKTNVSACSSIGPFFLPQLGRIWLDMLGLYRTVSGIISDDVAAMGEVATKTPKVRALRTIKKEILKLVETYVKKAEDIEGVYTNLIPGLFDAILGDYNRNVPAARDAEVLNVTATIVSKLGVSCKSLLECETDEGILTCCGFQPILTPQIAPILDAVFEPTLGMINQDFAEYPEHRVGFFKLLRAINLTCFQGAFELKNSNGKVKS